MKFYQIKNTNKLMNLLCSTLLFVILLGFSACTFEKDLKGFIKSKTEKAEIVAYEVYDGETKIKLQQSPEHPDEYFISSTDVHSEIFKIVFKMINPQRFIFSDSEDADAVLNVSILSDSDDSENTIPIENFAQDKKDPKRITVEYKKDQLFKYDGEIITPTISTSNDLLTKYEPLFQLRSKTYPLDPVEKGANVYHPKEKDDVQQYILFFNLPNAEKLGIPQYKDINKLIIEVKSKGNTTKYSFDLSIADNGTIKFADTETSIHSYVDGVEKEYLSCDLTTSFEKNGQAFYWETGIPVNSETEMTFKIYLKDEYGLISERPVEALNKPVELPVLGTPLFYKGTSEIKENLENYLLNLKQDKDSSESVITVKAPKYTYRLFREKGNPESIQNCYYRKTDNGEIESVYIKFIPFNTLMSGENFSYIADDWLIEHKDDKWLNEQGQPDKHSYKEKINSWTIDKTWYTEDATIDCEVYVGNFLYSKKTGTSSLDIPVPCGEAEIRVSLSKDKAITNQKDIKNLKTRVTYTRTYVKTNSSTSIGTESYPFKTLSEALAKFTDPKDTNNILYVSGDITEALTYPAEDAETINVRICKDAKAATALKLNINNSIFYIPDGSDIKLENLNVAGNIVVGENAKLRLANVTYSNGTITGKSGAKIILAGNTVFEDNTVIELTTENANNTAIVQVAADYKPTSTVNIKTVEKYPALDTRIIEGEPNTQGNPVSLPPAVYNDFDPDNPEGTYRFFNFDMRSYYIEQATYYHNASRKYIDVGIIKKSTAAIVEPVIGGFTVSVTDDKDSYKVQVTHESGKKADIQKLFIYSEGDIVTEGAANTATIKKPTAAGKYTLGITFTYDKITYSEEVTFIVGDK